MPRGHSGGLGGPVWATVLLLTAARLALAATRAFDLSPDEAYFWEWARHPAWGYYDQGPLVAWILRGFTLLLGDTPLGVRAGAILLGGLTALLVGRLAMRLGGSRRAALFAVLAFSLTPLGEVNAFIMTYYVPQLLLWTLALLALLDLGERPSRGAWLRLGLWMGLGGLTHHTFLWLGLLAAAWTLWIPAARRGYRGPWPYVALLLTVALVTPYVAWNAQHDWVGARHALSLVGTGRPPWSGLFYYIVGQFAVLTPLYLASALLAAAAWMREAVRSATAGSSARMHGRLVALATWPLFVYVGVLAWSGRAEANWTSAATVALAAGWAVRQERGWKRRARVPRMAVASLAVAALATVALHDISAFWSVGLLRFRDPSHDPTHRLHGWRELGQAAYAARKALSMEGPTVTATVDDYAIPAELSFYAPDHAATYCPPVSRRHHQYDFWSFAAPPSGGNAVWVTRDPIGASAPERALFRSWSAARPLDIVDPASGVHRRRFYLYLCRGFTGPPRPAVRGY